MKNTLLTRLLAVVALAMMIAPLQAIGQGSNRGGHEDDHGRTWLRCSIRN
jgi:hypothetical protein